MTENACVFEPVDNTFLTFTAYYCHWILTTQNRSDHYRTDVIGMFFVILHLLALPIVIIAALIAGLYPIAIVDGLVFLMLFAVEKLILEKPVLLRSREVKPRVQAVPEPQTR